MRVKPLVKAIVLSDDFRAAAVRGDSPAAALIGRKTTRPEQLGRLIADLTGYTWTGTPTVGGKGRKLSKAQAARFGDVSLLQTDLFGFRAMAGGVEGLQITEPSHAYSPPARSSSRPSPPRPPPSRSPRATCSRSPTATPPSPPSASSSSTSTPACSPRPVAAEDPAVDAGLALFKAGLGPAKPDTPRAWTLVLTALLQDPRIAFH
jgi:hypothetical protein